MRIRIMTDDDGHTFFVPVGQEAAFEAHLESVYGDDEELPMPDGVVSIGSSLTCYTFADPEETD
jgi:hypothetical protein